jgi:hypothetical protein
MGRIVILILTTCFYNDTHKGDGKRNLVLQSIEVTVPEGFGGDSVGSAGKS